MIPVGYEHGALTWAAHNVLDCVVLSHDGGAR